MTRQLSAVGPTATSPAKRLRSACFPGFGCSVERWALHSRANSCNRNGAARGGAARATRKRRASVADLGSCESIFKKLSIRADTADEEGVDAIATQQGVASAAEQMMDGDGLPTNAEAPWWKAAAPGKGKVEDIPAVERDASTALSLALRHPQPTVSPTHNAQLPLFLRDMIDKLRSSKAIVPYGYQKQALTKSLQREWRVSNLGLGKTAPDNKFNRSTKEREHSRDDADNDDSYTERENSRDGVRSCWIEEMNSSDEEDMEGLDLDNGEGFKEVQHSVNAWSAQHSGAQSHVVNRSHSMGDGSTHEDLMSLL